MIPWLVDHALPGIFSGGVTTIAVAVSHLLLRRHVNRVTAAQTRELTERTVGDGSDPV